MRPPLLRSLILLALAASAGSMAARAQEATNVIEALQARLDSGQAKLAYAEDGNGYLASVLENLKIAPASQLLVFSKSSLQFEHISPTTPRALYFNPDVVVGNVHDGRLLEVIVNDRSDGLRFYTLDVKKTARPKFEQQGMECTTCHGFASRWSPGLLVANLDVGPGGELPNVDPGNPFRLTYDTTPFEDRYGGWYVTGHTGAMKHRGNVTLDFSTSVEPPPGGLNVTDLSGRFDTRKYLSPGSDIVALLTLEHMAGVVNQVNQLNARQRHGGNEAKAEMDAAMDELARTLTFTGAVPLPSPVTGSSSFVTDFARQAPRDAQGRSLYDFDLNTRLMRYPLSFMVYGDGLRALDPVLRTRVWQRVHALLQDKDGGRDAIAIARATRVPGLPDDWR